MDPMVALGGVSLVYAERVYPEISLVSQNFIVIDEWRVLGNAPAATDERHVFVLVPILVHTEYTKIYFVLLFCRQAILRPFNIAELHLF